MKSVVSLSCWRNMSFRATVLGLYAVMAANRTGQALHKPTSVF